MLLKGLICDSVHVYSDAVFHVKFIKNKLKSEAMLLIVDLEIAEKQHSFASKFEEKMCDAGRESGHVAACPAARRLARAWGQWQPSSTHVGRSRRTVEVDCSCQLCHSITCLSQVNTSTRCVSLPPSAWSQLWLETEPRQIRRENPK